MDYDKETGIYSFRRYDFFDDVKELTTEESPVQNELKGQIMALKTADLDEENNATLRHMLSNISAILKSPLSVETEHVVKRALVDAAALIKLQDGLRSFNEGQPSPQLAKGLTALDSEVENLVRDEKDALNHQLQMYTNYIEAREE